MRRQSVVEAMQGREVRKRVYLEHRAGARKQANKSRGQRR